MSIRCVKCGSKNVEFTTEKDKSYSISKGLIGTALLGPGGAVMGIDGKVSESTKYTCRDCCHTDTLCMSDFMGNDIDRAIKENDLLMLRGYKKYYPNIEWNETKEEPQNTLKSYEQILAENVVKAQQYCNEHFDQPIYKFDMSKAIGITFSDCFSVIEKLEEKGLLTFHLNAEVKENDDIPYKYCYLPSEIEKNANAYKIYQEKQRQARIQERESKELIRKQTLENIRSQRQQERLALENNSSYVAERQRRILELKPIRERANKASTLISSPVGWQKLGSNIALLKMDGTVIGYGADKVNHWQNIIKIEEHFGFDDKGYIWGPELSDDEASKKINAFVNSHKDFKQIVYTGKDRYIGLKENGTVVTFGNSEEYNYVNSWTNIKYLYSGNRANVFGIKFDGTIACDPKKYIGTQIEDWKDIIQITTDNLDQPSRIIGLCADGTLEIYDSDPDYRLKSKGKLLFEDLRKENDIVAMCDRTANPLILLHKDGTVSIHQETSPGEQIDMYSCAKNVLCMRYITSHQGSTKIAICLHSDGSTSIIHTATDIGKKPNLSAYINQLKNELCSVRLFNSIDSLEMDRQKLQEQRKIEAERKKQMEEREALMMSRRNANLCQYCGGSFKGLFTKTCRSCGAPKDY